MTTFRISERRACGLLGVWRSSCRYQEQPDRNAALREELTKLAHQRPRFGYRRLGVLLERSGWHVNHKRLFRLYRQAGLSVKRTRRKKMMRVGMRQPVLTAPNQEWSLDFRARRTGHGSDRACVEHRGQLHARMPGVGNGHVVCEPTCYAYPRRRDRTAWLPDGVANGQRS